MSRSLIFRLIGFAIFLVILIGAVVFIFNLFKGTSMGNVKTLTITTSGKFNPDTLKVANNTTLKIKNDGNVNQTVKNASTNETVAEINPNSVSKDIKLKDNTNYSLYLAADQTKKATVTIGSPKTPASTTQTSETPPKAVNQPSSTAVNPNSNQPLPNTGPGDLFTYPLLAIIGFVLLKFSNTLWKLTIK